MPGSLWHIKTDEAQGDTNVDTTNTSPFKYKSNVAEKTTDNGTVTGGETAVFLRDLSNFWRSLEMLFINWKVHLELKWGEK